MPNPKMPQRPTRRRDDAKDTQSDGPLKSPSVGFRSDIEGLRAVALMLVLGFHARLPQFSGGFIGVDVFFVISGFLMTLIVTRQLQLTGRLNVGEFFGRRIRRILPAATFVLVAVGIAGLFVMPRIGLDRLAVDLMFAGFFLANIRYATQATDYLNEDLGVSSVLNYWSLGVEEQFYLVWPFALALMALLGKRYLTSNRSNQVMLSGLAVVATASFAANLGLLAAEPSWSFFAMPTRAWEFALGGAIAITHARLGPRLGAVLGWLGVGMIVASGFLYNSSTDFPGFAAVVPVVGTGLVLWSGMQLAPTTDRGNGYAPSRVGYWVSLGPVRWIGRVSFSWYLWHWPALILTEHAFGVELSIWQRVVVIILSLIPAYLTLVLLENPIRRSGHRLRSGKAAASIVVLSLSSVTVISALLWLAPVPDVPRQQIATWDERVDPIVPKKNRVVPRVANARSDIPIIYSDGCHLGRREALPDDWWNRCVYGAADGDQSVLLIGDSHAAQWFPALAAAGRDRGWKIISTTKSGCSLGLSGALVATSTSNRGSGCKEWLDQVVDQLEQSPPDLVVVAASKPKVSQAETGDSSRSRSDSLFRSNLQESLERIKSTGVTAVLIADPPIPDVDLLQCISRPAGDPLGCGVPLSETRWSRDDVQAAEAAGVPVIDLKTSICGEDSCEAIRFNRIVWRDTHHLTASYAAALRDVLGSRLSEKF